MSEERINWLERRSIYPLPHLAVRAGSLLAQSTTARFRCCIGHNSIARICNGYIAMQEAQTL